MENRCPVEVIVGRDGQSTCIGLDQIEDFSFENGDCINVEAPQDFDGMVRTPDGCFNIRLSAGRTVRLPQTFELFEHRGYSIPSHLITLTGAGPETLEGMGKAHIDSYRKIFQFALDMTVLEIGCGIGRDALQFLDIIGPAGRYIGVDVTRDSILWCRRNISSRHANFSFVHFDAKHELYNPVGLAKSNEFRLPASDRPVDFMCLGSVFTHLSTMRLSITCVRSSGS